VEKYKLLYYFVRSRTLPLPTSNISLMPYTFWRLIGGEILFPNPTVPTVFKRLKALLMQGRGSVFVFKRHVPHTSAELSTILIEVYVIFLMCLGSCKKKTSYRLRDSCSYTIIFVSYLKQEKHLQLKSHLQIYWQSSNPMKMKEIYITFYVRGSVHLGNTYV
jgi:hypothetical protein